MKLIGKPVYIEWHDATHGNPGWSAVETIVDTLRKNVQSVCASMGWVQYAGKDCIVIASHRSTLRKDEIHEVNGAIAIPRGWIKSIKVLKTK